MSGARFREMRAVQFVQRVGFRKLENKNYIQVREPTIIRVNAIRCPTCGAPGGQECESSTGYSRSEPHQERRLAAAEALDWKTKVGVSASSRWGT